MPSPTYGAERRPEKQREVYEQDAEHPEATTTVCWVSRRLSTSRTTSAVTRTTYLKYKDAVEGQAAGGGQLRGRTVRPGYRHLPQLALQDTKKAPGWLSQAAAIYRQANKPDQAIAIYRELLVSDAKNADGYHWDIAETLYFAHRWKEALTAYRGTDRFPDNYQRMAHCFRQLKQFDEAIGLYGQIMAGHPTSAAGAAAADRLHAGGGESEGAGHQDLQTGLRSLASKTGQGGEASAHLNNAYKIAVTLGGAKD